jgi:transcriptional regulator with XRE-family HTH domain
MVRNDGLHVNDIRTMLSPDMSTISLPRRQPARSSDADASLVLATATQRAAALLGLNGAALARILGVSEATVSRVLRGERGLPPGSKEGELALLLVRLYRSLDALVGNDESRRLAWMRSHNDALGGVPATLILAAQGLVAAVAYLDAMRAPV